MPSADIEVHVTLISMISLDGFYLAVFEVALGKGAIGTNVSTRVVEVQEGTEWLT